MIGFNTLSKTAIFMILVFAAFQQSIAGENRNGQPKINCGDCHTCPNPSADEHCLKLCPSLTWAQSATAHKVSEAPDSMLLGKLVKEYNAVHFYHKVHAEMSGMGKGCETCHHFSPPGLILPCGQCHGGEANPANLNQPSLKGAYHRQCLSCHREWSHDTKCFVCHSPLNGSHTADAGYDSTDIMGIAHPVITVPKKKNYYTPHKPGAMVTFYHEQHIEMLGLRCVDCHQEENCSYCHDTNKPAKLVKSMEEVHAVCSGCHGTDSCNKCHDNKEKPAFTHASTGWELNRYHKELSCRACHPTGKKISKLNSECTTCHGGWNQENFKHAITGLQLDEIHGDLDCVDCHEDRKFTMKPDCSGCHDSSANLKSPPGEYVKISLQ